MKVLQINKFYHPVIGGVETVVKQLAEGINGGGGFTVDVLVCNDRYTTPGKTVSERINGVHVTKAASLGVLFSMPVSLAFIALFRKVWRQYDVLHVHLPFPLAELALRLVRPGAKIVVTYHSDIVRQRLLSSMLSRLHAWVLSRADRIVVSNPNIVTTSPVLGPFKDKCVVIPFGVDTETFRPAPGAKDAVDRIRALYGMRIVLCVGRLVYYKGMEYLIRAMEGIDAVLVIIGEGPLRQALAREVRGHGLDARVVFLPYKPREELTAYYRAASAFVLPSVYRSEAFGITIIEAMACGLPVISTELGTGTSYANRDGVTGYVVPPRDSGAIHAALERLLPDAALSSTMGNAAVQRVRTDFTLTGMLDRYKGLYKELTR